MGDSKKMLQVRSARQVPVRVIMLDDELFNDSVDVSIILIFVTVCSFCFLNAEVSFTPG